MNEARNISTMMEEVKQIRSILDRDLIQRNKNQEAIELRNLVKTPVTLAKEEVDKRVAEQLDQLHQSRSINGKFEPDIYKWIIVKHKTYNLVHNYFQKGWRDIPQVDADEVNVLKGIKGLGARDEDIDVLADQSRTTLIKYFNKVRNEAITAWTVEGKKTLVFIYYSGHGV